MGKRVPSSGTGSNLIREYDLDNKGVDLDNLRGKDPSPDIATDKSLSENKVGPYLKKFPPITLG